MSEQKWTPEPWIFNKNTREVGILSQEDDQSFGMIFPVVAHINQHDAPDQWEANARRIVACVNACAGIYNETLEAPGSIAEIILDRKAEIERLRSELAELQQVFDLRWNRDQSIIEKWQAEAKDGSRALTHPDRGDLVEWLADRCDKAEAALSVMTASFERARDVQQVTAECWRHDKEQWEADRAALVEAIGKALRMDAREGYSLHPESVKNLIDAVENHGGQP